MGRFRGRRRRALEYPMIWWARADSNRHSRFRRPGPYPLDDAPVILAASGYPFDSAGHQILWWAAHAEQPAPPGEAVAE